jgi:iron complex transport system ATP-binding protein
VVTLHDLTLAALFCDRLVVLNGGRVLAAGTPAEVLTAELISDVYEIDARVVPDGAGGGRPAVHYLTPA